MPGMKSEFLLAIIQLAAERNLPKEAVFKAVEAALASAYRKDEFGSRYNISVKIHPGSGEVRVYAQKTVVEDPADPCHELSLTEAREIKKDAQLGQAIAVEVTPPNAGRIAAQTAKQVVMQRLREAEREFIFGEFAAREGEIVSGVVQRMEPRQVIIDLGKVEGTLPAQEQVRSERYRVGQRLKLYLMEVNRADKGPRLLLSRSHPNLVRRLFELEVPEVHNGVVELRAIAREPGSRTKIAVAARQEGVDPVGSCIGLRGIRIQNIIDELQGEKIDIISWHPEAKVFVANALAPARVISVEEGEEEMAVTAVVPDEQLSLAIGKEGQNARLAAKLTGWKIDIKSASVAEEEKAAMKKEAALAEVTEAPAELAEVTEAPAELAEVVEPLEIIEERPVEAGIRFAEDIFPAAPKPQAKVRKERKKKARPEAGPEDAEGKRGVKPSTPYSEEEEDLGY
jgi:N utilization substance protein A